VLASSLAGANPIVVAGLERDAKRLEVARALGASHTIFSDKAPRQGRSATSYCSPVI
jgi:threonine dehydrogenase-like Zn-dependent dehydrogenase